MITLRNLSRFLVVGCLLGAVLLVAADWVFMGRYDMDYSDAGSVEGGEAADWSTGERPAWAWVPAWAYAVVPLLAAGVFGALHPERRLWPNTRQCRGCE